MIILFQSTSFSTFLNSPYPSRSFLFLPSQRFKRGQRLKAKRKPEGRERLTKVVNSSTTTFSHLLFVFLLIFIYLENLAGRSEAAGGDPDAIGQVIHLKSSRVVAQGVCAIYCSIPFFLCTPAAVCTHRHKSTSSLSSPLPSSLSLTYSFLIDCLDSPGQHSRAFFPDGFCVGTRSCIDT